MVDNLAGGAGFHKKNHKTDEFKATGRFDPDSVRYGHRYHKVGGRRSVQYQRMMRAYVK